MRIWLGWNIAQERYRDNEFARVEAVARNQEVGCSNPIVLFPALCPLLTGWEEEQALFLDHSCGRFSDGPINGT
jgi:hypothetical protein